MPSAQSSVEPPVALSTTPQPPTTAPSNQARRASLKVLSRNINQVVLGNLLFRTWYYSPYPDSIVHGEDHVLNSTSTVSTSASAFASSAQAAAKQQSQHHPSYTKPNGVPGVPGDQNTSFMTAPRLPPTPCECLHVCPYCFRYTPKAADYAQHLRRHSVTYDPYSTSEPQPQSPARHTRNIQSPSSQSSDEEDTSTWPVPGTAIKVYEHAGYAVWDVDGDREKLYCQNLSLFGKLFLEQKSVFFDTGGFHYFVLTYTPQSAPKNEAFTRSVEPGSKRTVGRRRTSNTITTAAAACDPGADTTYTALESPSVSVPADINLRTQVLGFFSKENLSWDANNLACILVFPPYQHRNLGQLLMAVSYKLSGWEWEDSIIGGPEKPLSTMGRRSYLRFWSERVARFMMGQTADADGRKVFESKKRKKVGFHREEMTVKEIGDRTGMLAEDVVAALNEMGVLEVVPPKKKKRKSDGDEAANGGGEDPILSSMIVHRSKVLEWAEGRGVDLASPVKEEGFLGEWALSEVDEDEGVDDEEVEESE